MEPAAQWAPQPKPRANWGQLALRYWWLAVIPVALWDDGDHSVQCALNDPQDAELTASLRNSAR